MSETEYQIDTSNYLTATEQIIYEKDNALFVKQIEEILYMLDNRDYIKFAESAQACHERDTKIAAMAITKTNASILVKSEYPVPEGYIDLVLFPYQTEGVTALIELRYCAHEAKYIKKDGCSDALIKEKREEAFEELEKYKLAKEFQNVDVVKWILIFNKNKCVWNERVK